MTTIWGSFRLLRRAVTALKALLRCQTVPNDVWEQASITMRTRHSSDQKLSHRGFVQKGRKLYGLDSVVTAHCVNGGG